MTQKSKIFTSSLSQLLLFAVVIFVASTIRISPPHKGQSPRPSIEPVATTARSEQSTTSAVLVSKQSSSSTETPISASPKYETVRESVQKEYVYHMFASPNDPQYGSNWALTKVNAPAAWNVSTGNGQTIVAVIDSGFALSHEDLTSRWYTNNNEMGVTKPGDRCWTGTALSKQTNNCDDDGNGYVDDWRGWSFVGRDNNPQAGRTNSSGAGTQHGTEVAGIVGAASNNGVGMTSINWNTKIMPLQALDDDGTGYTSSVTAAIYYAVDNGAGVINLSLGAYANDPALQAAVSYAAAHNVVIVAAAGNCGDGTGSECAGIPAGTIAYPAAYPDVIAVGATTGSDQRAGFSSYGPSLDVSAPGYGIPASTSWSATNPSSLYSGALYGTSFASPQVASLASLIKSIRPSSSVTDVTALIDATATKPSAMNGLFFSQQLGHGVINAGTALSTASSLNGGTLSVPLLLQAGSASSEHSAGSATAISSGCQTADMCTVQLINSAGYKRFLPYASPINGGAGWSWSSDSLDSGSWEIRARSGESVSVTPYYLAKR